jgi:DNA polymerase
MPHHQLPPLAGLLKRFGPNGFLVIDFETRGTIDLRDVGTTVYAKHPDTEALCLSWKLISPKGVHDTILWEKGQGCPPALRRSVKKGIPVYAFEVWFERNIWLHQMVKSLGWPDVAFNQWRCIAAQAYACGLPRSLDGVGKVLDLPIQKSKKGHDLMLKMCKPRKPIMADKIAWLGDSYSKKEARHIIATEPGRLDGMPVLWHETREQLDQLGEYCIIDTDAEFTAMISMLDMSPREVELWRLDQRINLRGVPCDRQTVKAALGCLSKMQYDSWAELDDLTMGLVQTSDQTAKLQEYCRDFCGVSLPNMQAETVEAYLNHDLPDDVHRILEIRQLMAKASTKKYIQMWDRMQFGSNRMYGLMKFMGAQKTGRWSSTGVQLQNMARGIIKSMKVIDFCIECVRQGAVDMLELIFDLVTDVFSSLTRPMICAPKGHILLCADFSSIEVRVAFWLAGQKDALELIESTDMDPTLPDIYQVSAGRIFAKSPLKLVDFERQCGKISILGSQFGMAEQALQNNAVKWGLELDLEFCAMMKKDYRGRYTKVVATWKAYGKAVKYCIMNRTKVRVGKLVFECTDRYLFVHLPSGRKLFYFKPSLRAKKVKREDGTTWDSTEINYWGRDSQTGQWKRFKLYGAKVFQHAVQGLARDVMAEAMLRVDTLYPVIFTVHDEIVSEVTEDDVTSGDLSLEDFIERMSVNPDWITDCPIRADGWIGQRYRK